MAFKTRRENRRITLLNSGFSRAEARQLSKLSFKIPYMKVIIGQRRNEIRQWEAQGVTSKAGIQEKIRGLYHDNTWTKVEGKGIFKGLTVADPWAMLKYYERLFKARNPGYTTPHPPGMWKEPTPFKGV